MRNNKNIVLDEIRVGIRVKVALPTSYVFHNNKDRSKKFSWWKGKIIEVNDNSFTVYLGSFIGRMFISKNQLYKIIKCL